MTTLHGIITKKEVVGRMCAEEEPSLWVWEASLGRTRLIYMEMGTLGLVWHIFECFYHLCEPKFWSVSGLEASLPLWIMNLNEAFCVDYLMIHSNIAVTSDCAEKKIQDMFRWHFWFMAFLLWFIILRYSIWKANSLILSDILFFFSVKKAMLTSWEEKLTVRGRAFFLRDSSGCGFDSKHKRHFG